MSEQQRRKPIGAGEGPAGVLRLAPAPAQMHQESEAAYRLFCDYWREGRCLSLRQLSLRRGKDHRAAARNKHRWRWDARVAAGEAESPVEWQNWEVRRGELRRQEWELHEECLTVGRVALSRWAQREEEASLGEIVRLLEFAGRMARMAAGMPESSLEVSGRDGAPIRVEFEEALRMAYGPVVDVESQAVNGEVKDRSNTAVIEATCAGAQEPTKSAGDDGGECGTGN